MEKTKVVQTAQVNEEELELLNKFREQKRKQLLDELAALDSRSGLSSTKKDKAQKSLAFNTGYDKSWGIPKKIGFVVKEFNRVVTVREIFDRLVEYEPEVFNPDKETWLAKYSHVSSAVKIKADSGKEWRLIKDDGRIRVALLEWYENGVLKPEYAK